MGGSAAVLLGSVWLFNQALGPQLEKIRHEKRVDQFGFNFDEHAAPSDGWFAIDESTGIPVEVAFTDPVTDEVVETVKGPTSAGLPLKLVSEEGNDRYLVLGTRAEMGQGLGYVRARDLISAVGSIGWKPGTVYGFQRLYLAREGGAPSGYGAAMGQHGVPRREHAVCDRSCTVPRIRRLRPEALRRCGGSRAGPLLEPR